MGEGQKEESDQLPEEGPAGQVHDDDSDGAAREDAERNAGAEGSEGAEGGAAGGSKQATGNPANAGQE